ncbi:DUF998 domain-containing protein [Actinoplanes sp. NPDC023714]|uniref:DUF998 domain-containing protein n=1 Tax=Actinoplanes sp. NPDC023714 TaxID=3154322 RepID=UPI0033EF954E
MTTTTSHPATTTATTATAAGRTRIALAVAGPLWAVVSLAQVATRDGFDLMRHPLSLLSTGSLGWIQIANFVLAGGLLIAGAGALPGRWAPRLVRLAGLGMVAAGVLVMDPGSGFPAGTPDTVPTTMSPSAMGHMAAGSITFAALIATCYVLAHRYATAGSRRNATAGSRRYAAAGSRCLAVTAAISGTALLAGDAWAMSGAPAGTLTLAVGAITAMCFLTVAAASTRPA